MFIYVCVFLLRTRIEAFVITSQVFGYSVDMLHNALMPLRSHGIALNWIYSAGCLREQRLHFPNQAVSKWLTVFPSAHILHRLSEVFTSNTSKALWINKIQFCKGTAHSTLHHLALSSLQGRGKKKKERKKEQQKCKTCICTQILLILNVILFTPGTQGASNTDFKKMKINRIFLIFSMRTFVTKASLETYFLTKICGWFILWKV